MVATVGAAGGRQSPAEEQSLSRGWASLEVFHVNMDFYFCVPDSPRTVARVETRGPLWPGTDIGRVRDRHAGVKPQPRPCRRHWTMVDGCAAAALHPTSPVSRPGNTQGPRAMAADKHGRREMHMDRVPSCWPAIGLRRPVPSCRLPRTELQAVQYLLSLHHKICRHPFWTHYPCNMQARSTFVWVGK